MHRYAFPLAVVIAAVVAVGCRRDMADQPRFEPYEINNFFANQEADRPLIAGTVARGHLRIDEHFFAGKVDGEPATTFPQPPTMDMLERGRERYGVYCVQCHDQVGNGQGMVVRRGFPRPPSFHISRLREAPVGYYFDVITNGFGRMPSHAYLVTPADRWAIISYIRALQLSQHAESSELSAGDLEALAESLHSTSEAAEPAAAVPADAH